MSNKWSFKRRSFALVCITLALAVLFSISTSIQASSSSSPPPHAPATLESPDIFYVTPTGTENTCLSWEESCDLQTALATAFADDQIWVAAGTYTPGAPGVNPHSSIQLKSGVALFGGFAGTEYSLSQRDWIRNPTILSGDLAGDDDPGNPASYNENVYHVVVGIEVNAAAILDGFTIRGGYAYPDSITEGWGGGMYLSHSSLNLSHLVFRDNYARAGAGIFINSGQPVLHQVEFRDNTAFINGGGLHTYNGSAPYLSRITFYHNTAAGWGGGMINMDSTAIMGDITFANNTADAGAGLFSHGGTADLDRVQFVRNVAWINGGGLHTNSSSQVTVSNSLFYQNEAWCYHSAECHGGGIYHISGVLDLTNVTIADNRTEGTGGGIYSSISSTLTNSIVDGNSPDGIAGGLPTITYSDLQEFVLGEGNISLDPEFASYASGNLRLLPISPVIDAGNNAALADDKMLDLDGSLRRVNLDGEGEIRVDMGAYEAQLSGEILYVDPDSPGPLLDGASWENAFHNPQAALAAAQAGNQIWVADGVYLPGPLGVRQAAFELKNGVEIYGGFAGGESFLAERDWEAHPAVLSGDLDGGGLVGGASAHAYHVLRNQAVDSSAILDGFTITQGYANGEAGDMNGGGMNNLASSPTLRNLIFIENIASYGGGMFNSDISAPALTNITFENNAAIFGGGIYNHNSSPSLAQVNLVGNYTWEGGSGAGMANIGGSSPTLTDVTFMINASRTRGGGMYNEESSPELERVRLIANSAGTIGGGIYNIFSNLSLTNVLLYDNSANQGGGISNQHSSDLTLINVSLFFNHAVNGDGSALDNLDSSLRMANAIVWGNDGSQIYSQGPTEPDITYSIVEGGYPGEGNLDADPLFASPGLRDLRLQPGSPAIDAGQNAALPIHIVYDLDGNPRFIDMPGKEDTGDGEPPLVDMGTYEAQPVWLFLPVVTK